MKITVVRKGSLVQPVVRKDLIIAHVCNNVGAFGAGVALAIRNAWPWVAEDFVDWSRQGNARLGSVRLATINRIDNTYVANMVAQEGLRSAQNPRPLRYESLSECLEKVARLSVDKKASVHIPYLMGCQLAGGNWDQVLEIVRQQFSGLVEELYIYDFNDLLQGTM